MISLSLQHDATDEWDGGLLLHMIQQDGDVCHRYQHITLIGRAIWDSSSANSCDAGLPTVCQVIWPSYREETTPESVLDVEVFTGTGSQMICSWHQNAR